MEMVATRKAYGNALAELGAQYDLVVMDADLSGSTNTGTFKKAFPDRFINCGIAEGNMVSTAAGIAATGKTVFASSFAVFASGRAFEQIRNSVAYPNLNVKIAATHAGISVGEDGASHQAIADIAIMRVLPNMIVLNPADAVETRHCVEAAILHEGPAYIRLGRLPVPVLFDERTYQFEFGKGITLADGQDLTIVATGLMTYEALKAVETLKADGIYARLINIHTIKPLDKELLIAAARETGHVITVEEHSVIGGLGSAVAEVLCEHALCHLTRMGVQDVFGQSGKPYELLDFYGLTERHIVSTAKRVLKK